MVRNFAFFLAVLLTVLFVSPNYSAGEINETALGDSGRMLPLGASIIEPPTQGVTTYEQLQEAIYEGEDVTFGSDIIISEDDVLGLISEHPLQINTGQYSLIVKGIFGIGENISIAGDGVNNPVIVVQDGGFFGVDSCQYQNAPEIRAVSAGGTAISFEQGSECDVTSSTYIKITSEDGIGIKSQIPLQLVMSFIDSGNGSGIVSEEEVSLLFCRVEGSIAVDAPSVVTDTSILISHGATEYSAIRRRILMLKDNYRYVMAIGEEIDYTQFEDRIEPVIFRADDADDIAVMLYTDMDVGQFDTSTGGIFPAYVKQEKWMELCGLLPSQEPHMIINVSDLKIPVFGFAWDAGDFVHIQFRYSEDISNLKLWRSDDDGITWRNVTEFTFDQYDDLYVLDVPLQMYQRSLIFWEVEGGGDSEVIRLEWSDDELNFSIGGDRGGFDRGENVLNVEKKDNNSSSGGSSGSDKRDEARPQSATGLAGGTLTGKPATVAKVDDTIIALPQKQEAEQEPDKADVSSGAVVNSDTLSLSGAELLALIEINQKYINLAHNGMWISLPVQYFADVDINSNYVLTIDLEMHGEDSFYVDFKLNGAELAVKNAPFIVSMPWKDKAVVCITQTGEELDAVVANDVASFLLYNTGTYQLSLKETAVETAAEQEKASDDNTVVQNKDTNLFVPVSVEDNVESQSNSFKVWGIIGVIGTIGLAILMERKRQRSK